MFSLFCLFLWGAFYNKQCGKKNNKRSIAKEIWIVNSPYKQKTDSTGTNFSKQIMNVSLAWTHWTHWGCNSSDYIGLHKQWTNKQQNKGINDKNVVVLIINTLLWRVEFGNLLSYHHRNSVKLVCGDLSQIPNSTLAEKCLWILNIPKKNTFWDNNIFLPTYESPPLKGKYHTPCNDWFVKNSKNAGIW